MRHDTQPENELNTNQPINRRRMLHIMGAGAASIAGASLLSACWPFDDGPARSGGNPTTQPTTSVGGHDATPLAGARPLSPYFLGFNNVPIHSPAWGDANVMNAAKQFRPGILRYPGGTIANYWDWQKGWFLKGQAKGYTTKTNFTLDDLKTAVDGTGAQPLYVLNVMTSDLNTQMNMLRTAKSKGLPVQYIELGNEFYLDLPGEYARYFPDGANYGQKMTSWIAAIKKEFPDAQVSLVGGAPAAAVNPRKGNWTQTLVQSVKNADAVSFHPYIPLDNVNITSDAATSVSQLDSAVLGRWQQYLDQINLVPNNAKIWLTEYNLVDSTKNPVVFRTWIHGLSAVKMTLAYLEHPNIEFVCFYDLIGATGNELVFFDPSPSSSDPNIPSYGLTAAGYAMRLLSDAIEGMSATKQLSMQDPTGAVVGWVFADNTGGKRSAVLVNTSDKSVNWTVDKTAIEQGKYAQLVCKQPFKTILKESDITKTNDNLGDQLALPAYSITEIKNQ